MLPGRAGGGASRPSWGSRLSRPLRGMPWLGAKGLLPGRGAPGRGAGRASPPLSRAAGARGGAVSVASATGRAGDLGPGVGALATEGASERLTDGAAGASTEGAMGAAGATATGGGGAATLAAVFFATGFFAASLTSAAGLSAAARSMGNVSRILRTTGGSMVEDADRTNSPFSFRWLSKILLSTPSSFASS